jgi:hypothetical protein
MIIAVDAIKFHGKLFRHLLVVKLASFTALAVDDSLGKSAKRLPFATEETSCACLLGRRFLL